MRIWVIALSLVAALTTADTANAAKATKAEQRVALVVGNSAYKHIEKLDNPVDDADAMAALLKSIGFRVIEGTNLTREAMTERLLEFGKKAQGADIAVFYYAGQGIAIEDANYLLPVDSDIKSEMDVKLGAAIDIDLAIDQTMSDAKVKLVFLDTSRSNPFASSGAKASRTVAAPLGLPEMKSGENTLIAYATGPGQTALDGAKGGHSPFTKALLDNLATPGLEIQDAMTKVRAEVNEETDGKQLPWGHTHLLGPVYLKPAPAPNK
jgi:uncharacterized caspase-like protein